MWRRRSGRSLNGSRVSNGSCFDQSGCYTCSLAIPWPILDPGFLSTNHNHLPNPCSSR
jgi:hypothetical protein